MNCGVGCKCRLDPALLWLWHRPAAAVPIRPLTWGPPCATGVVLKRQNQKTKQNKKQTKKTIANLEKVLLIL